MKLLKILGKLLKTAPNNQKAQLSGIAPHIVALKFRAIIVECLLLGRVRFDEYHPDVISASNDLKGFLEKSYSELFTSPFADDKWYRALLEAGLVTYGRQDLIGTVIEALPDDMSGHQTGICVAACSRLLQSVLPLPSDCHCGPRVNCDKQMVNNWFNANRANLRWDESLERFVLVEN